VSGYDVESVQVNSEMVDHGWIKDIKGHNVVFDVPFPIDHEVKIRLR
jgi:hypothetical protein